MSWTLVLWGVACHTPSPPDQDPLTPSPEPRPNPALTAGVRDLPHRGPCLAGSPPPSDDVVRLEPAVSLQLDEAPWIWPQEMARPAGGGDHWYVALQGGRIIRFRDTPATDTFTEVLDLHEVVFSEHNQLGLMSLVFHPDFAINGQLFVYYNRPVEPHEPEGLYSRISRFTSTDGGATFSRDSEEIVLDLYRGYALHNGGHLEFGPEGYLWVSLGDGGGELDPAGHGQDPFTLWSGLLRLDVDSGVPYAIPPDNPFADGIDAAPELYAYGFRNPWQWTLDDVTGEIWLTDVGSHEHEEVNYVEAGGNYGWSLQEGPECHGCDPSVRLPAHSYPHESLAAVIGGRVYRGDRLPQLRGYYLFTDFFGGWLRGIRRDPTTGSFEVVEFSESLSAYLSSFAEDDDGEIWVIDRQQGAFYTLAPPLPPGPGSDFPQERLSQTGCVDPGEPTQIADELIPYELNAELWSDGASKERYLRLPEGTTLQVDEEGDLSFPEGSVLIKHFRLDDRLVETRLLVHHVGGLWRGYSYAWDEDQADAVLLDDALEVTVGDQVWQHPSPAQCMICHTPQAGYALGPELPQLDRWIDAPQEGIRVRQLEHFQELGLLPDPMPQLATMHPLDDLSAPLGERVRSYLHANCAHCHRAGGLDPDLRFLEGTQSYCLVPTTSDARGTPGLLLDPGDPQASALLWRMTRPSPALHMPPLGAQLLDQGAVDALEQWIEALVACPVPR